MYLIFTNAGKPVYSSEKNDKIPEFCAILQTIGEFFSQDDNNLISFVLKKWKTVFLKRNSLVFTVISTLPEIIAKKQLILLYNQLISHFTERSLQKLLSDRPNVDLSHVVLGVGSFIKDWILAINRDTIHASGINAVPVLKCPKNVRDGLKNIFTSAVKRPNMKNVSTYYLI